MKSMKLKKNTPENKKPKNTALPISEIAKAALIRIKSNHGINRTFAIERGVIMLEKSIAGGAK